jgi:hypothetical protein
MTRGWEEDPRLQHIDWVTWCKHWLHESQGFLSLGSSTGADEELAEATKCGLLIWHDIKSVPPAENRNESIYTFQDMITPYFDIRNSPVPYKDIYDFCRGRMVAGFYKKGFNFLDKTPNDMLREAATEAADIINYYILSRILSSSDKTEEYNKVFFKIKRLAEEILFCAKDLVPLIGDIKH